MQQLLNPFAQKYPDTVDSSIPSQAVSIRFNPRGPFAGHYFATGTGDGLVIVWDVETRGVARVLEGHVKAVGGLWNNRYLLSASLDSTAIIWDLSVLPTASLSPATPSAVAGPSKPRTTTPLVRKIRFDAPVATAVFHPRNSRIVLATLTTNDVVLVDLRAGGGKVVLDDKMEGEGAEGDEAMDVDGEEAAATSKKKGSIACADFSPCGSRIYAGTTRGMVLILDPVTRFVIQRVQVATSAIRQLAFDSSGRHLILSCADRALRVLRVDLVSGQLTATHRFQDAVNRTPWHSASFSGDGEYVLGGAGNKAAHNIYVWDRDSGALVKVLEGPTEPLLDCDWHPTRPIIASVGNTGNIHIWQTSSPDNWAAFAPGFEELEENVEYDEREDEFDIEDETDLLRRQNADEDLNIDVLRPDNSWPVVPPPVITLPPSIPPQAEDGTPTIEGAAIAAAAEEVRWAEMEPDDDDWEGFYLSLDLVTETEAEPEEQ